MLSLCIPSTKQPAHVFTMLFDPEQLNFAIEMQAKSYALLKWVGQSVSSGVLSFRTAHEYSMLPHSAAEWIDEHYLNIPSVARVDRCDISVFANFFSTYLENSFELIASPGKVKYSPDAHCFCPMCSWMIDAPHLKTKTLTASDKKRATKMQCNAVMQLALDVGVKCDESSAEKLVAENVETTALLAYGHDLIKRLNATATGPAVLVLWRRFAWNTKGSPKPRFQLSAKMLLAAESQLRIALASN